MGHTIFTFEELKLAQIKCLLRTQPFFSILNLVISHLFCMYSKSVCSTALIKAATQYISWSLCVALSVDLQGCLFLSLRLNSFTLWLQSNTTPVEGRKREGGREGGGTGEVKDDEALTHSVVSLFYVLVPTDAKKSVGNYLMPECASSAS